MRFCGCCGQACFVSLNQDENLESDCCRFEVYDDPELTSESDVWDYLDELRLAEIEARSEYE